MAPRRGLRTPFNTPSYLCIPDVHTFVEGATGQMPTIGAESHAVDGLLVFSQRVDADASLHIPKTNRGVKGRTVEGRHGTHGVKELQLFKRKGALSRDVWITGTKQSAVLLCCARFKY